MRRKRKRANGEGAIVRLSGKRRLPFAAVLVVGWTPEGRPIRRARCASSETEAKALLREMHEAWTEARPLPDDRLTVGKWLAAWLGRQGSLRPSTRAIYDRTIRLVLPHLGQVPLRRLQPGDVERMLTDMSERYAWTTVSGVRAVLSTAMKDAIRAGHRTTNPAALARAPRGTRTQLPAPDASTVLAALAALEGHRLRPLYVLLAATGLRIGEALGLRWEDLDGERLTVRHQLTRDGGEYVLAEPKSVRSRRTVLLPQVAVLALRANRAKQAEERLAAGPRWREADLLFANPVGQPVAETTAQWVLAEACKRAGVRHMSPHDLRRFAATIVAATGDMKAAQTLLGHTSATLTADVYASPTEPALRRAAEALQEAMGG